MDLELDSFRPDPDVFFREVAFKVLVDPYTHTFWQSYHTKPCRFTIGYVNYVCKHIQDCKVVLDYKHCPVL